MMRIKFNKWERVAGTFVLVAVGAGLAFMLSVAQKQGWFDAKTYFSAIFENADGVHPGSTVQMAGLRAGAVDDVDLLEQNKIRVRFYVLSRFRDKIRKDSKASLMRPFLIGERVVDVTVGTATEPALLANAEIGTHESMDLMTALGGHKISDYLESFGTMLNNVRVLADGFLDKNRTESLIQAMDRIDPLLKNMNTMSLEVIKLSKQVTKDDNIGTVVQQLAKTTQDLNAILPLVTQKAPEMAQSLGTLVNNMTLLTEEFKTVVPALREVGPVLPVASRRAIEALDEAVVLMKAMQKSFFVKANAEEVREEEAAQIKKGLRKPANLDLTR